MEGGGGNVEFPSPLASFFFSSLLSLDPFSSSSSSSSPTPDDIRLPRLYRDLLWQGKFPWEEEKDKIYQAEKKGKESREEVGGGREGLRKGREEE